MTGTHARSRSRRPWTGVLVPVAAFGLAGLLGGLVWAWWSDPATYTVTAQLTFMDEAQLGRLFAVEARYTAVGLTGGVLVGSGLALGLRRTGWMLVAGVLLGSGLAALVSYLVGGLVGPDQPAEAATPAPGDLLPAPFEVQTPGLFLAWTIGALAGLMVTVWLLDREAPQSPDTDRLEPSSQ